MEVGQEAGDGHSGMAGKKTRESGLYHNMFVLFFL